MIERVQNNITATNVNYTNDYTMDHVRIKDISELYIQVAQLSQESHRLHRRTTRELSQRQFDLKILASWKTLSMAGTNAGSGLVGAAFSLKSESHGKIAEAAAISLNKGVESYKEVNEAEAQKLGTEVQMSADASRKAQDSADKAYSELQKLLEMNQAITRTIFRS